MSSDLYLFIRFVLFECAKQSCAAEMDFQHRAGSKTGGGGMSGSAESSRDRKERLRKLAMETIDLAKVGVCLLD